MIQKLPERNRQQWGLDQAQASLLKVGAPALGALLRNLKRWIFPRDQLSIPCQSSPVSNSNSAIGPALPSGLNKIHMNPIVAVGSIHCDTPKFVAVLTALPAFNGLLEDWTLLLTITLAFALGRPLDWIKMTPVSFSPFASTRFRGSCQWKLGHI